MLMQLQHLICRACVYVCEAKRELVQQVLVVLTCCKTTLSQLRQIQVRSQFKFSALTSV